jgi:SAM-dependent methyltransferase
VTTLDRKRNPQDPEKIAQLTLEHYNQYAEEFWQGTRDHDVSQNIAALLQYIRNEPPFKILDFGCGPGRDLKTFAELGHIAIGLEGAVHLAVMARAHSGCEVWEQDFLKLDLPDNHFDGVFANAALFHVPSQELPRVLLELKASLKPGGVLFSSNPRGHNEEGVGTLKDHGIGLEFRSCALAVIERHRFQIDPNFAASMNVQGSNHVVDGLFAFP